MHLKKTQKLQNGYKVNPIWKTFIKNINLIFKERPNITQKQIKDISNIIDIYNNTFNTTFIWREVAGGYQLSFINNKKVEVASTLLEY